MEYVGFNIGRKEEEKDITVIGRDYTMESTLQNFQWGDISKSSRDE